MSANEEQIATESVTEAVDELMDIRANLTTFFSALDDLAVVIRNSSSLVYPSRTNTFDTEADSMSTFLILLENEYAKNLPADQLEAHLGHVDYPGKVPSGATPLSDQVFQVRGTYEGLDTNLIYAGSGSDRWTSTALYLVAGTTMTVTIPSSVTGDGISIRVGCHTDNLSSKTSLNRMPEISRSWDLSKEVSRLINVSFEQLSSDYIFIFHFYLRLCIDDYYRKCVWRTRIYCSAVGLIHR